MMWREPGFISMTCKHLLHGAYNLWDWTETSRLNPNESRLQTVDEENGYEQKKKCIHTAKAPTPVPLRWIFQNLCASFILVESDSCPLDILFWVLNRETHKHFSNKEHLGKTTKPEEPSVFFRVTHNGLVHQSPTGEPDCVSDSPSWHSCQHDQCGCRLVLSHFNLWRSAGAGSPVCCLWK